MAFCKPQVSFSSNIASFFNVIKKTLLYFFSSNIEYFVQKKPIKVQIFEIFECFGWNSSNYSCHFEVTSQFPFNSWTFWYGKVFQSFAEAIPMSYSIWLVDCVPYVLKRWVSSSFLVVNLVWKLWLSPGKKWANCSSCSSWQMNRQLCNFMKSWNFRIQNFLKLPHTLSLRFLK